MKSIKLEIPTDSSYLATDQQQTALIEAIKAHMGAATRVSLDVVKNQLQTIAEQKADRSTQRMEAAQESINNDPNVKQLVDMFGAQVEPDSIRPVNGQGDA